MHIESLMRAQARLLSLCGLVFLSLGSPLTVSAADGDFSDVPTSHYAYQAVKYLKQQGILDGYADNTFRPEQKVNRAEAIKIIATPLIAENEKKVTSSRFQDVMMGAWYVAYVEWAAKKKIIDGPPSKLKFFPDRPVTKAEFLKMFLVSRSIDPNSFGDIAIPLSSDVKNIKDWSYPYMRYAIASTMTFANKNGIYNPTKELTRGDVALLLHRYFLYKAGQRIQETLTETQTDIERVLDALEENDDVAADYASGRAVLMIRGALEIRPNEPMVKVIVKIAEGYRALVRSYRAGMKGDWKTMEKHAQDAWYLGDQAKKITPNAETLAVQLQKYATILANQARSQQ